MRLEFFRLRVLSAALGVVGSIGILLSPAFAAEIRVDWNAPTVSADGQPLTDLAGFNLYIGTASRSYNRKINIGHAQSYNVLGLANGRRYYFALTAYDRSNNESALSAEAELLVPEEWEPAPPDIDGDGILDEFDDDMDNDGLLNAVELGLGTNPALRDTDLDGVYDGQEVSDGSNPIDPGSALTRLGNTLCGEWNGYLGGMWNVFEHVNLGDSQTSVESTMYDSMGIEQSVLRFPVAARGQFDLLVHDAPGRALDAYGRVCSRHFGVRDTFDGRMVYYRPDAAGFNSFDFVLMMPMTAGKSGKQYVAFNSRHPSLAPGESANAAANWIQLSNLSGKEQLGWLAAYDLAGQEISRRLIGIPGGGRIDLPAHEIHPSVQMGLIEWIPAGNNARFTLRNIRYYYDNPWWQDSFDGAVNIEAAMGSTGDLIVPVDTVGRTSALEVVNTGDQPATVEVEVTTSGPMKMAFSLAPKASYHLVLDQLIGPSAIGYASVKGVSASGAPAQLAAWSVQYARRSDGGIMYVYGMEAKPLLGRILRGSYNTFLDQVPWLIVVSPVSQPVQITMTREDGSMAADWVQPVSGAQAIDLSQFEPADRYGVVKVQPQTPHSVQAWVMRVRGDQFVLPTPVR